MQSDVKVEGNAITGELAYIEGGLAQSGPLAGSGNFLALKFAADDWDEYTSVKVGLVPSASGMDLVEVKTDPDKNGVFKITGGLHQVFRVQASTPLNTVTIDYDLSGLTLDDE